MRRFKFLQDARCMWLSMFALPWRNQSTDAVERGTTWTAWIVGWTWTLAGLAGGAVLAPGMVQAARLANTPYQDWLAIAIAVLASVLVQLCGLLLLSLWGVATPDDYVAKVQSQAPSLHLLAGVLTIWLAGLVAMVLPVAGIGYAVYRYLTWVGPGQHSVAVAFVGGLLIKTFAVPLIKGLATGALFKWFTG